MVVMNDGMLLPQVLEGLHHPDLNWISEFDLQHQRISIGVGPPHWITLRRSSLLIYGKPGFRLNGGDNVNSALPTSDELPLEQLRRNLLDEAMALICRAICPPRAGGLRPHSLDRASTALAARKHGCYFIGADQDEVNLERIRRSLMRDAGDGGPESTSQAVSPEGPNPAGFPHRRRALPNTQANPNR